MRPEVVEEFGRKAFYFNTFGGNAEAALAVLEVIQTERPQENSKTVGTYPRGRVEELATRHEVIGDVPEAGLFLGVEIVSDRAAKTADGKKAARIVNDLREAPVLISACGANANILKTRPPRVFTAENLDFFADRLDKVLSTPG